MKIAHLLLHNFGKFEEFSCDFTPGLNLIKGPNEAGKSTLANAITAALFLNPADGSKELTGLTRWESGELPALEAVLDIEGKTYKLIKDFKAGKTKLENQAAGIENDAPDFVGQWLCEQMGIPSEEIFKATACISQGEIDQIESSFEAIKDKLESLVTGGKEEKAASNVLRKIRKRTEQICGDGREGSGEIAKLEALTKEIDYNVEKLGREIVSLKARRADLIQVEMAYKNVRDDLASKKEHLEQGLKANLLEENYRETSSKLKEVDSKISEAQESLKKIKSLRDRQTSIRNIDPQDTKQINSVESALSYLQPQRRELETEAAEAKDDYETYKVGQIYISCAILGALGCAAMVASYFTGYLAFLSSVTSYGFLISIALFVFGLGIAISRNQHRKYLGERSAKLDARFAAHNLELQSQNSVLKELLVKYSVTSLDELRRSVWQHGDLEAQVVREREIYDNSLGGEAFKDLEAKKESLEESIAKITKVKKELAQYTMDESEVTRQTQVISQFEERIKDLERERTILHQQLETAEGGAELLAGYVERREQLDARALALRGETDILQLTADCINEARQNVLVSTLEVLNHRTSDILNRLTSGRYSKVRFDKSTMKFEIFSDSRREWLEPDSRLSSGTLDQVYLATRLALAELIEEDKSSVMILDDPFAGYDQRRMENAMKVLKEFSEDHQILLLTSQDHYDKWADSMVALK